VLAISFSAILVREAGTHPFTAAFYRCAYAVPVLYALRRRSALPPADRRERLLGIVAGGFLAVDLLAWHEAIQRIGAGFSTVLGSTQVLFVLGLAMLGGAVVPRRSLVGVPIAIAGIVLIRGVGSGYALDSTGVALGLFTGLTYACFLVLYDRAIARGGSLVGPLFDVTATSAVICFAAAAAVGAPLVPDLSSQLWLALLALSSQVLGWILIAGAFRHLRAVETSVLLLIQPVLTVIWGMILFDERVVVLQAIGIAITLAGVAVSRRGPAATPG